MVHQMIYRRLGSSGLKLSELSLGAWVTYGGQVGEEVAVKCMSRAYDAGVNFFDNAEAYADGNAERVMGNVIKKLGWRRESIVVSSKVFWGGEGPNDKGLSHKHVFEGCRNSLKRLQLDYLDLFFCHRPDPNTPIEETVRAMDDLIYDGKILYWGTSEWSAADIMRAHGLARENIAKTKRLDPLAKELGCTMAQLALAWCLKNLHVSTVITGASRPEQVSENMKALEVPPKLDSDILEQVEIILGNKPQHGQD